MANWTARLNKTSTSVETTDNAQTAREFVNWATLVLQQMSNREFEAARKAVHSIDTIKSEILTGNYTQDQAIAVFNKRIGR